MATVSKRWMDGVLFILAIPVLLLKAARRSIERFRFLQVAMAPAILCKCGSEVSLVGQWRCSCGYTYRGHLVRFCPVCGSIPCVVRCYRCGVTTKLPEAQ